MNLDPQTLTPGTMYRFLIGVVVPRPIAFVSTVGKNGRFNVAPFSFFNAISGQPALLGISINLRRGVPKDTLRHIRETGDFVVNVVDEALNARAVEASGDWPEDVDEFQLTGLTPAPSERIRSPRVAESPVHLECRLEREIDLGQTVFVVGEVVLAHVREDVLTDGHVDIQKLKPVGRLGGDSYSPVRDVVHFPRPKVGR